MPRDFPKIPWLTAIFLHLPVRVRALKAAPDTAGHLCRFWGLRPQNPLAWSQPNAPINCNFHHSLNFIVKEILFFCTSTLSTLTFTTSPRDTAWEGCLMNLSDSWEIWTKPS